MRKLGMRQPRLRERLCKQQGLGYKLPCDDLYLPPAERHFLGQILDLQPQRGFSIICS